MNNHSNSRKVNTNTVWIGRSARTTYSVRDAGGPRTFRRKAEAEAFAATFDN
jgi:hypothetical protein